MTSINIKFIEQSVSELVNLDIEYRLPVIGLLYTETISCNSSDRSHN
ncbi:MAG: hypothetical protein V7L12_22210 [Nostoc sp.]